MHYSPGHRLIHWRHSVAILVCLQRVIVGLHQRNPLSISAKLAAQQNAWSFSHTTSWEEQEQFDGYKLSPAGKDALLNKAYKKHRPQPKGVDPHYELHTPKTFSVTPGIPTEQTKICYGTAYDQKSKAARRNHENHKIRHRRLPIHSLFLLTNVTALTDRSL